MSILLSVVIPVYNAEKTLARTVKSIGPIDDKTELILVNDGSSDNSYMVCEGFESNYCKVINQNNSGQLIARQNGVNRATGDYVMFLDSDDTLEENAINIIQKYLINKQPDCLIFGLREILNGQEIERWQEDSNNAFLLTDKQAICKKIFTNNKYNSVCRKVVKRSILLKHDNYDAFSQIRHAEDLIQTVSIVKNIRSVLFVPDVLYNYMVNPQSITHNKEIKDYQLNFKVQEYVYHFLEKENILNEELEEEYRIHCLQLLYKMIIKNAGSKKKYQSKKHNFNIIKSSDFYNQFFKKCSIANLSNKQKIIISLYRNNNYFVLTFMVRIFLLKEKFKGNNYNI